MALQGGIAPGSTVGFIAYNDYRRGRFIADSDGRALVEDDASGEQFVVPYEEVSL
ncbi:hypothetical protein [Gordonia sihwensis]|uniref:hypothetical protein n=1 Tax=Gordonia sihwensis TaxID=173559 RepID=UPI003D976666